MEIGLFCPLGTPNKVTVRNTKEWLLAATINLIIRFLFMP
jgi:hypothetical protein